MFMCKAMGTFCWKMYNIYLYDDESATVEIENCPTNERVSIPLEALAAFLAEVERHKAQIGGGLERMEESDADR